MLIYEKDGKTGCRVGDLKFFRTFEYKSAYHTSYMHQQVKMFVTAAQSKSWPKAEMVMLVICYQKLEGSEKDTTTTNQKTTIWNHKFA